MVGRVLGRYGVVAAAYDVTSLEWPVYRPGRRAGVASLDLAAGDRVLDLACGTGLSFALLRAAVGPEGAVVGVDGSAVMLAQARRRVRRHGWDNVEVVTGDAARLPPRVRAAGPFDAVLAAHALSVVEDWHAAWRQAFGLVRPGGRAAVVDLALPRGHGRAAARLACWLGGADPHREPWRAVEAEAVRVTHRELCGGHVHVVSGTRPS